MKMRGGQRGPEAHITVAPAPSPVPATAVSTPTDEAPEPNTCHVPNCPEPPERVLADGVCHKHRAAEVAAAAQADWAFWRDLEEYDPRIVIERERRERAERQARRARVLEEIAGRRFDGDGTPYGVAALGGIVRDLSKTREGGRNDALTRASFRAGGLVAGGEVDPGCAIRALREAGRAMGLPEHEVKYVVKRAFDAGLQRPRSAPERRAA